MRHCLRHTGPVITCAADCFLVGIRGGVQDLRHWLLLGRPGELPTAFLMKQLHDVLFPLPISSPRWRSGHTARPAVLWTSSPDAWRGFQLLNCVGHFQACTADARRPALCTVKWHCRRTVCTRGTTSGALGAGRSRTPLPLTVREPCKSESARSAGAVGTHSFMRNGEPSRHLGVKVYSSSRQYNPSGL